MQMRRDAIIGIVGIGGGHSCGVEIMALRTKIIMVLCTKIIVSADRVTWVT